MDAIKQFSLKVNIPKTPKNSPKKPPIVPKPFAKKRTQDGNGTFGSVCIVCVKDGVIIFFFKN